MLDDALAGYQLGSWAGEAGRREGHSGGWQLPFPTPLAQDSPLGRQQLTEGRSRARVLPAAPTRGLARGPREETASPPPGVSCADRALSWAGFRTAVLAHLCSDSPGVERGEVGTGSSPPYVLGTPGADCISHRTTERARDPPAAPANYTARGLALPLALPTLPARGRKRDRHQRSDQSERPPTPLWGNSGPGPPSRPPSRDRQP